MSAGIVLACVDVGSVRQARLGWALVDGAHAAVGSDLHELAHRLISYLLRGFRVAVGFECPLYVPLRTDPATLTERRIGEHHVNWCGGPGGSVLATGLVQARWVLQQIADAHPHIRGTTRFSDFVKGSCQLLVWEAFVTSRDGRTANLQRFNLDECTAHQHDALSAAAVLAERMAGEEEIKSELGSEPAISLIGLHLISSGLSEDRTLLSETCLVVKARKSFIEAQGVTP